MTDCTCSYAERSLGILYGINMGKGLVRITTHPQCPRHSMCRLFTSELRKTAANGKHLWCNVHERTACP